MGEGVLLGEGTRIWGTRVKEDNTREPYTLIVREDTPRFLVERHDIDRCNTCCEIAEEEPVIPPCPESDKGSLMVQIAGWIVATVVVIAWGTSRQ